MSYLDISPQQLAGLIEPNKDIIIFDSRDSTSFNQGHIPGARMILDSAVDRSQ
jgi:rhodanese-related sulfurtransferase